MSIFIEAKRTGNAGALSPAGALAGASPCDWASDCRSVGSYRGSVVSPLFPVLVVSAYAGAAATVTFDACKQKDYVDPGQPFDTMSPFQGIPLMM